MHAHRKFAQSCNMHVSTAVMSELLMLQEMQPLACGRQAGEVLASLALGAAPGPKVLILLLIGP